MKPIKNLSRFAYASSAFVGWRLSIERKGASFVKYFSDRQYGGKRKAFIAGKAVLAELEAFLATSKLVDGKYTETTIEEGKKLLNKAR